jgi:mxaD protein
MIGKILAAVLIAGAPLAGSAGAASAMDRTRVSESVKLTESPAKVWARVGHFGDLSWHPLVKAADASDGDRLDSQRRIELGGGVLWESLMDYRNGARVYQTRLFDNGGSQKILPVARCVSTLEVRASEQGSEVVWSAEFQPAPGVTMDTARKAVSGLFRGGLDALAQAETKN